MLSKIKPKVEKAFYPLAKVIGSYIHPNFITALGLLIAVMYLVAATLHPENGLLVLGLFVLSTIMDMVDGAVARVTGRTSKVGALLDSTSDRVADSIYAYSAYAVGICSPIESFFLLVLAYMVSYVRARAEGLGLKMAGVGLMERGERVLAFFTVLISRYLLGVRVAYFLLVALIILTGFTVIQRMLYAAKELRG